MASSCDILLNFNTSNDSNTAEHRFKDVNHQWPLAIDDCNFTVSPPKLVSSAYHCQSCLESGAERGTETEEMGSELTTKLNVLVINSKRMVDCQDVDGVTM